MRLGVMLVVVAACSRSTSEPELDGCLPLPPASRAQLVANPDGQSLYWLERQQTYDYDADIKSRWRLMRFDVRTRRAELLLDDVTGPNQFLGGQLMTVQDSREPSIVLDAAGQWQELTPVNLDVLDVELVDRHTLAFLADGIGARAVYVLDLGEQRPYHLVDADVLLSTSGGRVFARAGDDVVIVDVKTRATSRSPYIKKSVPQGDKLVYVENGTVLLHDTVTGSAKPVITTQRPWKLVYQTETTLVRSPTKDERSYAYLLAGEHAQALPTIVGGASILETAALGKHTWAMIGHNTTNYLGDLGDTNPEVEICRLSTASEMQFATRTVPARFVRKNKELLAAVAALPFEAGMQMFDHTHEPTTLFVDIKNERAASDFTRMRTRARTVYDNVTRMLADREIRTEVRFADRRTAYHRWRRDRLRTRTVAGMGDALLSDPAEYDFEVLGLDNTRLGDTITCAGTLKNLTGRALPSVDIKCSGNRSHVIHVENLAADEARPFAQTFEVSPNLESAFIEIMVEGKPSEPRDVDSEAQNLQVFEVATAAYAATGLWLDSREVTDDEITVTLTSEYELLQQDPAKQEAAIKTAYEHYERLRGIYKLAAETPLSLRVYVSLSDSWFDYDGVRFERN